MTVKAPPRPRPGHEDTEVALKLWVVLNRASRAISGRIRASVERNDLSLSEFGVLEALYAKGPLLVVDKLEDRGLLVRRPSPGDRRALRVELTAKGRKLIARIFPEHAEQFREAMSGLRAGEQRELTAMLKRLGVHAGQNG